MTIARKLAPSEKLEKACGVITFASLLVTYRDALDISQTQLAKKLGISRANLCDLEKGRKFPSPGRAAGMARKLGEIEHYWVQVVLQDILRAQKLPYIVKLDRPRAA